MNNSTSLVQKSLLGLALAVALASNALAEPMAGLTPGGALVFFDSESPGVLIGAPVGISGLVAGETLVGIDTRPATGQLHGFGSAGRLYAIGLDGIATTLSTGPTVVAGAAFGVDFNPTVDRFRVVSDVGSNARFNPLTGGLAGTDTTLSPAGSRVGVAYDRNVSATGGLTTMFVLDSASDSLGRQGGVDGTPSPNAGVITTVGPLGVDTSTAADLDISASGAARAVLTVAGVSGIYSVNLTSGAATLIGNSGVAITDASFVPAVPARQLVNQLPVLNWTGLMLLGLGLLGLSWIATRRN